MLLKPLKPEGSGHALQHLACMASRGRSAERLSESSLILHPKPQGPESHEASLHPTYLRYAP